jgi:tRNA(Ile)-lysidine synthase
MSHSSLPEKVAVFAQPLIVPGSSVVVAVSGGSDSVALLYLLHELQGRLGITLIVAAHLNHGLRGVESDGDELLVREHATRLGIGFFVDRSTELKPESAGLEAAAREVRYRFLHRVRAAQLCTCIATGHTLDDQAETVLMRLIRGSGLNGLRGIAPSREDHVIRPLLGVRKKELSDWLDTRGIAYRTDRSNHDIRFFRNRIRHAILPELEACHSGAAANIASVADSARAEWAVLEKHTADWCRRFVAEFSDGSFRIAKAGLENTSVASEGLRQLFSARNIEFNRPHILDVFVHAARPDATFLLPGGWKYRAGRECLLFEKVCPSFDATIPVPGSVSIPQAGIQLSIAEVTGIPATLDCGTSSVFVNGDRLGTFCRFRTITPHDTFVPFGTGREVNMLGFLAKQKITLFERERTGCLFSEDNKPVWICALRLDDRFRVESATKRVIKVQSLSIL